MPEESRIKRWRANKHEQGLKHVSVWLTPEEELRLKDLVTCVIKWRAFGGILWRSPDTGVYWL